MAAEASLAASKVAVAEEEAEVGAEVTARPRPATTPHHLHPATTVVEAEAVAEEAASVASSTKEEEAVAAVDCSAD